MGPFAVVAIIAGSLFVGGTIVKPMQPQLGSVLQAAGVGTLAGGALGTISVAGVSKVAAVTAGAVTGGVVAGTAVPLFKFRW